MLPKISVVTPSYNQGAFLEKALASVRSQEGIRVEHIVVDGGSRDNSVDLLQLHQQHLAWWVSESDTGQSNAINKGFRRATGDILCWLNSDDYFAPGALRRVAEILGSCSSQALVGHCISVEPDGSERLLQGRFRSYLHLLSPHVPYSMHQPSIFWRREIFEQVGFLNEHMNLIMDFDYWCRIARHTDFVNVDAVLSYCHRHPQAKTADEHRQYHLDRRLYIEGQRRSLGVLERCQLAAIDLAAITYTTVKNAERGLRHRLRDRFPPVAGGG